MIIANNAVKIEFPGYIGMEVSLTYLGREELMKLRKRCVSTKFDKKTRQPEEVLDEEKFLVELDLNSLISALLIL